MNTNFQIMFQESLKHYLKISVSTLSTNSINETRQNTTGDSNHMWKRGYGENMKGKEVSHKVSNRIQHPVTCNKRK